MYFFFYPLRLLKSFSRCYARKPRLNLTLKMQEKPFKIFTSKNQSKVNVVYVDQLTYLKPPKHLSIGVYSNREKAYQDYLKTKFQNSTPEFMTELLSIYRLSILKEELTLETSEKTPWIKEGFKNFMTFIAPILGQVTGQKVDLDKPFDSNTKMLFENC